MTAYAFIVLSLGNPSMSDRLRDALAHAAPLCLAQQWSEADLKGVVLLHVVTSAALSAAANPENNGGDKRWAGIQKLECYLWENLEVRFTMNPPKVDHEGGSVYYAVQSGQIHVY